VIKIVALTAFALIAFAFNSILCRMALRTGEIDPASFTAIRLVSGALTLSIIIYLFNRKGGFGALGNWYSAFFLFAYAICFSLAYIGLTAGTGALILFGSVQVAMIGVSVIKGERPSALELLGLVVAIGGLVFLVLPGLSAPPLVSAALMAIAGVAWGFYTLRGKGSSDPLADTGGNFLRSVPMILLAAIPFVSQVHLSARGVVLAAISGAVTSGIGYTVWYAALRYHTPNRAAALQLSVPVIAAGIGVALLSESFDTRSYVAAALIIGGIGMTIACRSKLA